MVLLGDPGLPFRVRFNLSLRAVCAFWDCFAPALVLVVWLRCRAFLDLPSRCFLALIAAGSLADLAWLSRCSTSPSGGSYARWREVPAVLFKVMVYGLGPGCVIVKEFMDRVAPSAITGRVAAGGLLLSAARLEGTLLMWAARPARITWALPAHIVFSLHSLSWNRRMCSSAALTHPVMQQTIDAAYQLLGTLRFRLLPSISAAEQVPTAGQCCVVMAHLQLMLGLVLPAVAQAAMENSLFMLHQQQRWQLGLPPEAGRQAALHRALHHVFSAIAGPTALTALWIVLGIVFDVSVLLYPTNPKGD